MARIMRLYDIDEFGCDGAFMKIFATIINLTAMPKKLTDSLIFESGYMVLAEASVNFDGSFEINLPDIVLGYSYRKIRI